MYRTVKLKINSNKTDLNRLKECNKESAVLWNLLLGSNKSLYDLEGRIMNKKEMREVAKSYKPANICATNKWAIVNYFFDAYNSISRARKSGRKDLRYPWKTKEHFVTEWDTQTMKIDFIRNSISLTTARFIGYDKKPHNGKPINIYFKTNIPKSIKTLKLVYEFGCYYACISYEIEQKDKSLDFKNYASIDLGEIHSITSIDNNKNQLIITGREIRSIKQFRNKKESELKLKMNKCEKNSNQYKRYKESYDQIRFIARKKLNYHIHKLTRMYVNWAVENKINTVFCGDVTGIELSTNKSGNSMLRQKINQWEYGKTMDQLEYKLAEQGINFIKVSEAYSSQICPCCGIKNKPKNRNYECNSCGEEFHRDIVGAWNILNFNHKLDFVPSSKTKYLRIT